MAWGYELPGPLSETLFRWEAESQLKADQEEKLGRNRRLLEEKGETLAPHAHLPWVQVPGSAGGKEEHGKQ